MPDDTDYTNILRTYNPTNLPSNSISVSGDGLYHIGYTILTASDVPTMSYGSDTDYYGTGTEYQSKFVDFTPEEFDAISVILKNSTPSDPYSVYFGDVANVTFTSVSDGAIAIGQASSDTYDTTLWNPVTSSYGRYVFDNSTDTSAVTFNYNSHQTSTGKYGDVWLNANYSPWTDVTPGTDEFRIILHELGHALGLKHPTADSAWDNEQYSIMSYNPNPNMDSSVIPSGL